MRALSQILAMIGRVVLAAIVLIMVSLLILCVVVDQYGQKERVRPVDAIVILGAQVLPNGEPGPDLLPRIEKATWLYKQGYATSIVCAGGEAGDAMSAAAIARRAVIARGVPGDAVFVADGSRSTREDAIRSALVLQENGWRTAVVVTHPLHVLRATLAFRRAGVETCSSPTTTAVTEIPWRWRAFYAAREAVLLVFDFVSPNGELPAWMARVQRLLQDAGLNEIG